MRLYELAAARYPATQNRCVSCGFFGKHKGDWFEASLEERTTGHLHTATTGWFTEPACIRGAANLAQEQADSSNAQLAGRPPVDDEGNPTLSSRDALLDVLNLDRRCPEWYPFTPGFSPKEHVEQLLMMQLEEDRRKHEVSLAQLQSKSDERAVSIAQSLHQVTVETGKFTTKWTYIAVGLAGAALLVVLATYVLPDFGRNIGDVILGLHPAPTPTP
jgi:hypothetical protein